MDISEDFRKELSDVKKSYPNVIFSDGDEEYELLWNDRTNHRRTGDYKSETIDVQPGILSSSKACVQYLDDIIPVLNKELPVDVKSGKVGPSGIRSSWNNARHLAGFAQERASNPMYSNRQLRADKGLSNEWVDESHKLLFEIIVEAFFSKGNYVGAKYKDKSSGGNPFYYRNKDDKIRFANEIYDPANMKIIKERVLAGDLEYLFREYGLCGPNTIGFRDQATDKITEVERGVFESKERPAVDLRYAASGGLEGKVLPSSKSLIQLGFEEHISNRFAACRRRVIYVCPIGYSVLLLPVAQAIRDAVYDEYSFTLHHTTPEQKREKISQYDEAIAVDVSNHDMLWPIHLYLPVIEETLLRLGYEEWWVRFFRYSLTTGTHVPCIAPGEGGYLIGSWRNPDSEPGLTSGNPFTDLLGSIGMIFNYFLMMFEHVKKEEWKSIKHNKSMLTMSVDRKLRGEDDIAAPSKSDDAYLLSRGNIVVRERTRQLEQRMIDEDEKGSNWSPTPYMHISYEKGGGFLGDLMIYTADYDMSSVKFEGDVFSDFKNTWNPEYACHDTPDSEVRYIPSSQRWKMNNRAYPGIGFKGRAEKFESAPSYKVYMDVVRKYFAKHFSHIAYSWDTYIHELHKRDTKLLEQNIQYTVMDLRRRGLLDDSEFNSLKYNGLSSADYDFVNNTSVHSWKYGDGDINDILVSTKFVTLDDENLKSVMASINTNLYGNL